MMELYIKNKWISLGGSTTVTDSNGNDVFYVKGKVFSFTKKKFLEDKNHKLKYTIRIKLFTLFHFTALIYDENNEEVIRVTRKFFSLHDHYTISSNMGDLKIVGNILQFNYKITLNGKEIGHIARKISLRDSFVLTLEDGYDPEIFTALVIAIDNITDTKDQSK